MTSRVIMLDIDADLSRASLLSAVGIYEENFGVMPWSLVVGPADLILSEELLKGGPIAPIELQQLPTDVWFVSGPQGMVISGGA